VDRAFSAIDAVRPVDLDFLIMEKRRFPMNSDRGAWLAST
jgi:hypothetical protein